MSQDGYKFTKQELLHAALQIASGMEAIHAKEVVHCDLKPENILVKPAVGPENAERKYRRHINGVYKIADFGMAHKAGDATEPKQDGYFIGTLP
jgi:serine/threonine protein kinase